MYGSILPLMRLAGFGRRKRRGGRKMLIQGSGRRRVHRRRMRGRGFFDTLKNLGSKALNIVRSVPVISTGLRLAGQDKYSDAAKSIGLGRRRRTRRGGRMSVYGGRRRRATRRRFSVFGGRKRRYHRKRGGRKRKMRGGLLSTMLRGLLGGRRKRRYRRKRMGGRKRTYRMGLFSRRR